MAYVDTQKAGIFLIGTLVTILCMKYAMCADEPTYTRRISSSGVVYPRRTLSSDGKYLRRPSSSDTGLPRRTSKTVVTRPAMRLRYRPTTRRKYPVPSGSYRRVILRGGGATYRRYGDTKTTSSAVRSTTTLAPTTSDTTKTTEIPLTSTTRPPTTLSPTTEGISPPKETTTTARPQSPTTEGTSSAKETATTARPQTTASRTTRRTRPVIVSRRKPTKHKSMDNFYSLRRFNKETHMEYNELMKKLDYFMAYYPSVREAASRINNMLSKHEQSSREARQRLWKGMFRVKSDLRTVNAKCERTRRNVTEVLIRSNRRAKEFRSYQEANKRKIDQIEIHQGSQDDQYFEVYQRSTNNTKEIQRLTADMSVLLPLVTNLLENFERSNMQEKRALEMLDSHARGNIAEMTNQILVQQNTLANLGNQVRSEMDLLHAEKHSMAKSMEQNNRRLTETVNSHLSTHVKQMNQLEGSLNRQSENIKYITTVVSRHDDLLNTNEVLELTFLDQVANISEGLKRMEANISRYAQDYRTTESQLNRTKETVEGLERNTQHLVTSLSDQHKAIAQTMNRMNATEVAIRTVSEDLEAHKVKQGAENAKFRGDLDQILEMQRAHRDNISTLLSWRDIPTGRGMVPHYPSDEPAPESTSVTPHELKTLLAEIGVEERMTRLTRVLRHQQQRMSNVTRAVKRIAEDNQAITDTTSQYYNLITSQSKVIKEQNDTISKLAMIATKQGDTITRLSSDLMTEQETVMKLTHILANIAAQFKSPMGSQRDCHDVWLNGNRKSGVYNVIEDMSLRPVQCNLTDYGGWTVIQRRKDGSQDFDRTMKEYQNGFGDIYGEYWIGLDTIMRLTQKVRPDVALQIVMEDWSGQVRTATYSRFYLYGKSYSLSISGYAGDAGDSLSHSNGMPFTAKRSLNDFAGGVCANRRSAGWWFTSPQEDCGESSLNGVYRKGPTQDARIQSTIYWKRWHGVGYPLKSATMQIIPADVFKALQSRESTEINGHLNGESSDTVYSSNHLESNPYGEQPYGVNPEKAPPPTYEEDLRESGVGVSQPYPTDYENFDYNMLLNDG